MLLSSMGKAVQEGRGIPALGPRQPLALVALCKAVQPGLNEASNCSQHWGPIMQMPHKLGLIGPQKCTGSTCTGVDPQTHTEGVTCLVNLCHGTCTALYR